MSDPIFRSPSLFRKWPGGKPDRRFWPKARRKCLYAIGEHCGRELNAHGVGFASKAEALRFPGAVDQIHSPRLAVNPPNAILNYLYAILEAETRFSHRCTWP